VHEQPATAEQRRVAEMAILGVVAGRGGKIPAINRKTGGAAFGGGPAVLRLLDRGLLSTRRIFLELTPDGYALLESAGHNWKESGKPHPWAAPPTREVAGPEIPGAAYDAEGKLADPPISTENRNAE